MEPPIPGWPPDEELDRADSIGIDAPFGWPDAMVDAVERHARGEPWPQVERERLRYRETDRFVHRRARVLPLSVSSDRIAVCAWRCAELLSARGVDRTGAGGVVEVYPAGALAIWGLPHRGYKRNARTTAVTARDRRGSILDGIRRVAGERLELPEEAVLETDDGFDAFVSALVARAAAIEQTIPPPPEQREIAAREGWIHLPLPDSLATVLKSPKPTGPSS